MKPIYCTCSASEPLIFTEKFAVVLDSSSLFSFDKEFSWSSSTSKAAEAAALRRLLLLERALALLKLLLLRFSGPLLFRLRDSKLLVSFASLRSHSFFFSYSVSFHDMPIRCCLYVLDFSQDNSNDEDVTE